MRTAHCACFGRIGGADFTDAVAFLNWLYFKTKPSKRGA
jgi:hypothetical protein